MKFTSLNNNQDNPYFIYDPKKLSKSAFFFFKEFSGKCIYAVKANPLSFVLKQIKTNGISAFDTASLNEAKLVRGLFPNAEIFFMNPVKSPLSIEQSYFRLNVRNFALDHEDELEKILKATNFAKDLRLHLRISISNNSAKIPLTKKFGAKHSDVGRILSKIRIFSNKVGVSFHNGSQCMEPDSYKKSMNLIHDIVLKSGVDIKYFNIGGGFPSEYTNMKPKPLGEYFRQIKKTFAKFKFKNSVKLLAEPGRAIVSDAFSLVVRVELRKGRFLFINDGKFGNLFAAGEPGFSFPVKLLKKNKSNKLIPFSFYGPTCDSSDFLKGPFFLPENTEVGDLILINNIGAYSFTMRTNFNGFPSKTIFFKKNKATLKEVNC